MTVLPYSVIRRVIETQRNERSHFYNTRPIVISAGKRRDETDRNVGTRQEKTDRNVGNAHPYSSQWPEEDTASDRSQYEHFSPNFNFCFGTVFGRKNTVLVSWHFPNNRALLLVVENNSQNKNLFLGFTSFPKKELLFLGNSRFLPNQNRITRLYVHPTRFDY
jgi:hypothetical protein